jgi:hypothetical protein
MSANVIKFPKRRRPKNGTPGVAAAPATVTQLSRRRGGLLEQELRRAFDGLDEAGKQFMNGYWQALLDQRGLR